MSVHLFMGAFFSFILLVPPFLCFSLDGAVTLFTSLFKANYFVHQNVTT